MSFFFKSKKLFVVLVGILSVLVLAILSGDAATSNIAIPIIGTMVAGYGVGQGIIDKSQKSK